MQCCIAIFSRLQLSLPSQIPAISYQHWLHGTRSERRCMHFIFIFCNFETLKPFWLMGIFPFFRCLDFRTVNMIAWESAPYHNESWTEVLRKHNKHNAYDDCIEQIRVLKGCNYLVRCFCCGRREKCDFNLNECVIKKPMKIY